MADLADANVVVVGAGPAGACAAIELARAGMKVVLLERGPFPGSKNMYGGVVYGRILDTLIPKWWAGAPSQRSVTRRATKMMAAVRTARAKVRLAAAEKARCVALANSPSVKASWTLDCTVVMAERRSWAKAAEAASVSWAARDKSRTRRP